MNLIDELIGGQWSEKTAKLLNQDSSFSNLATFQHFYSEFQFLIEYLTPKHQWGVEDAGEWEMDLAREPKNTIDVLRALKRSWECGNYGVIGYE